MTAPVKVRAPGKVNLALRVGGLDERGFHPLTTVFHAVSLFEDVTVRPAAAFSVRASGARVPLDETNLAMRAARALAAVAGERATPVAIELAKGVPVAGGMAGGSADAAATLVACSALWGLDWDRERLLEVAATLGSDVGFPLYGESALGRGYGNDLTPLPTRGDFTWVFALQREGLSTPAVFREFDALYPGRSPIAPDVDPALAAALAGGDPVALGTLLTNDLQPAALSVRPDLEGVLALALAEGAAGAIVSGSGPTIAALATSTAVADAITARWHDHPGVAGVRRARGGAAGAHVI
ncbi:4-(cytidine 5'-diphospho)-2-C-methyl-D-erythritol kinase [Micrococcales bacterium 31B]|nr:4-(cytidine 5'-diphospho)-2-C-methyl-D-erythritol kinase [Micrococcales bacterium 31B]